MNTTLILDKTEDPVLINSIDISVNVLKVVQQLNGTCADVFEQILS